MSTTNENREERLVKDVNTSSWSPHWTLVNDEFEAKLALHPHLKSLSSRMFFIYDGNHRFKAWTRYIDQLHWNDQEWHTWWTVSASIPRARWPSYWTPCTTSTSKSLNSICGSLSCPYLHVAHYYDACVGLMSTPMWRPAWCTHFIEWSLWVACHLRAWRFGSLRRNIRVVQTALTLERHGILWQPMSSLHSSSG